jgi:hypothetical protein
MNLNETFKLVGEWTITRVDANTGTILDTETFHNIIVNTGKERVAKLLNGISFTYFQAIGIGTGTTGALVGDSTLEDEFTRSTATLTYETGYKAKFAKTFSFGTGVSESITEASIFDSATVSGSTMFNRVTFTAKVVTIDVQLIITCNITVV